MNSIRFAVGVIAILFNSYAIVSAQKVDDRWITFVSAEGKFKISFPGEPKTTKKPTQGTTGSETYFETSLGFDTKSFLATLSDHPANPDKSETARRRNYDILRDGFVTKLNAKLLNERDVHANGKLGREISLALASHICKMRYYVVENRFIQLITVREKNLADDPIVTKEIDRFLDSFQFTEK